MIAAFGPGKDLQSPGPVAAATAPADLDKGNAADECNPFGYKTAWIAVKSDHPISVLNFLKAADLRSVSWNEGINTSYNSSSRLIAVTPALEGWVLLTGSVLLDGLPLKRLDGFDKPEGILRKLSEHFGEAQFFGTHRVTETHLWASWHQGKLSRYFYCDGSQGEVVEEGVRSEFEAQQFEGDNPAWTIDDGLALGMDEESVMEVAETWSVNPHKVGDILAGQKSIMVTLCRLF